MIYLYLYIYIYMVDACCFLFWGCLCQTKKNVRPRLGKAVELAKGKDCPSKMQTKTPGMFSLNSIAFWWSASTSYLASVAEQSWELIFLVVGIGNWWYIPTHKSVPLNGSKCEPRLEMRFAKCFPRSWLLSVRRYSKFLARISTPTSRPSSLLHDLLNP